MKKNLKKGYKYKPLWIASNKPFDGKWLYEMIYKKPYALRQNSRINA